MTIAAEPKTDTPAPAAAAPAPAAAPAATPAAEPKADTPPAKAEDGTILGKDGKPEEVKKEEVKTQGAPEKYLDFKLPEGTVVDKAMMGKFMVEAKAAGLSQEMAQKFVTLQAESAKSYADTTLAEYQTKINGWKEESVKLYGPKSQEEFGVAAQAINRFGSPALREILNETGLGNHPELVQFFVKIGHAIKEENPADGVRVAEKQSDADLLYGNSMKGKAK